MRHWLAIVLFSAASLAAACDRVSTTRPAAYAPQLTGIDEQQAKSAIEVALAELRRAGVTPSLASEHFMAVAVTRDALGVTTCRFVQHNRGIRVVDHEALVHTNSMGVTRVGAVRFLPNAQDVEPATLSPEEAIRGIPSETVAGPPSLVIWPFPAEAPRLAYEIVTGTTLQREILYLDARTGEVAGRRALTMTRH